MINANWQSICILPPNQQANSRGGMQRNTGWMLSSQISVMDRCSPAPENQSPAAVVKTMNMDFHPDFTLLTLANTIWETHRMMSSRISTAFDCRMTTTKGLRKSFWNLHKEVNRAPCEIHHNNPSRLLIMRDLCPMPVDLSTYTNTNQLVQLHFLCPTPTRPFFPW